MTVQTDTNVARFTGNGASTYPVGFKFNSASDLVVEKTVISTGEVIQLTLNSDYSVKGAGEDGGGSITFLSGNPTSQNSVTVTRVIDLLQETDLRNQGKFYAEVHEDALDRLIMIAQQLQTETKRAIKVPSSDPLPATLPPFQQRSGMLMSFDEDGNPIAVAPAQQSATELSLVLANSTGSSLIGHGGGTVNDALQLLMQRNSQTLDFSEFASASSVVSYLTTTQNAKFITGLRNVGKSFADVAQKMLSGGTVTMSAVGDSLTYGFEEGATGAPINGSTSARSLTPFPETVGYALIQNGYPVIVTNRGFPGDRADQALSRWPNGSGGADVVLIMFGTNDAKENPDAATPFQTPKQYADTMMRLVQREQAQGSYVIVLAPPFYQQDSTTRQYRTRAYSELARGVAQITGAGFIDVSDALPVGNLIYRDAIHLTAKGYNAVGYSIASHFLGMSMVLPKIGPRTDLSPQWNDVALGSPVIRDTSYNQSFVYKLAPGEKVRISGEFTEDVRALITTVERTATPSLVNATIHGGSSRTNDATDSSSFENTGTAQNPDGRGGFLSPIIMRGNRTLEITGISGNAVIERIQFLPASSLVGFDRATPFQSALSGTSIEPSSVIRSVIATGRTLGERFVVEARLSLPESVNNRAGVGLTSEQSVTPGGLPGRYVFVARQGNDLVVIQHDSGTTTTLATVAGAFTTGQTNYKIRLEVFLASLKVSINDTLIGTYTIAHTIHTLRCWPFAFNGNTGATLDIKWLKTT
ncbi:GDSL-type esterase/lipase family protein [Stutzerimonas nitrititolerans]|uniref:GDSL-type esterase/lipase family protein n=1 Tax=Stutzerimonas nitrititolerans TaxID=2482751 RepID=UPI002897DCB8|nr:GDSL-type esterase/lipase family protein [Stutzerimonas nitrititolerans]